MNRLDRVFQHDEAKRLRTFADMRQLDEPLQAAGHADERLHGAALLAGKLQGEREAEIGDEGERVRRVDRERGQHREDRNRGNSLSSHARSSATERVAGNDHDAGVLQAPPRSCVQSARCCTNEIVDLGVDGAQLLGGRQPVVADRRDELARLALQAGDAHHQEFVEVLAGDRQEAQPLEQRMIAGSPPPPGRAG